MCVTTPRFMTSSRWKRRRKTPAKRSKRPLTFSDTSWCHRPPWSPPPGCLCHPHCCLPPTRKTIVFSHMLKTYKTFMSTSKTLVYQILVEKKSKRRKVRHPNINDLPSLLIQVLTCCLYCCWPPNVMPLMLSSTSVWEFGSCCHWRWWLFVKRLSPKLQTALARVLDELERN